MSETTEPNLENLVLDNLFLQEDGETPTETEPSLFTEEATEEAAAEPAATPDEDPGESLRKLSRQQRQEKKAKAELLKKERELEHWKTQASQFQSVQQLLKEGRRLDALKALNLDLGELGKEVAELPDDSDYLPKDKLPPEVREQLERLQSLEQKMAEKEKQEHEQKAAAFTRDHLLAQKDDYPWIAADPDASIPYVRQKVKEFYEANQEDINFTLGTLKTNEEKMEAITNIIDHVASQVEQESMTNAVQIIDKFLLNEKITQILETKGYRLVPINGNAATQKKPTPPATPKLTLSSQHGSDSTIPEEKRFDSREEMVRAFLDEHNLFVD